MTKLLNLIKKGSRIIVWRLQTQGIWITLAWFYGRGLPLITGIPIIKYSRITPEIYVGSQYRRVGKGKLERLGINGAVNLRSEFDDAAYGLDLEHYCHLPTIDDAALTLDHLNQGIAFIRRVTAEGGKVYIHCAAGVGRAPTMAAAYFISQGLAFDEAIALIKKSRPFIKIMPPQLAQLKQFETMQLKEQRA